MCLAERHTVVRIKTVVYIPVPSVQMVYCEVSASLSAYLTCVIISFHYSMYKLSVTRIIVPVRVSYTIGDVGIIFQTMTKNRHTRF